MGKISRKDAKAQKVKSEKWRVKNYGYHSDFISRKAILFHAKTQRKKSRYLY